MKISLLTLNAKGLSEVKKKKDVIPLSELKQGAKACLQNAERLLNDAKILFKMKGSYPSCFALIMLSMEEMAKASKLNDYFQRNDDMPREEWKKFTRSKNAHVNKLLWMEQKDTSWISEVTKIYEENLRKIASRVEWAEDLEDFHRKIASVLHKWKLHSLYVDYDFNKGKWNTPSRIPLTNDFFIELNEIICQANITKAKFWISKLTYEILKREATKE